MLIGLIPLWRDILKWRTIPHPFTTGVWFILVGFNTYVLWGSGEYWWLIPAWVALLTLMGETVVWWVSMKHISINWFDILCVILSIICMSYYIVFRDIIWSVIFTVFIDILIFLPTIKKWWLQPWTETAFNYIIGWLWQACIVLTLTAPVLETSLFWLYVCIIDTSFVVILLSRRYYLKWWKSIFE